MRKVAALSFLLLVVAGGVVFTRLAPIWAGEAPSGPLICAGSGSNLAITRLLAQAFGRIRPEIRIEIPSSLGTTGGIRAAGEGAIAVGLISRPLREQEKGWGLTVLPYARTAVVIGAHPTVSDEGITFEDLVSIYRGSKSRWKNGQEIIVLTREPGDSSIEVLERTISGFTEAYAESHRTKRWTTVFTDQEMNRTLAKTPYAIGLSDVGTITADRLPIRVLRVNGVLPTPEDIRNGRYPLVKTLAFVFRNETLPAGAKAYFEFVRSEEGQKILRMNGFLPVE